MADRILSVETLFAGWFDLLNLRMVLNGQTIDRALVRHPTGAAILAYDPARRVAMTVAETRAAVLYLDAPRLIEAVAGVAEAGEDTATCARREVLEEVGVRLGVVEPVGRVWLTPSSTTERVDLFLGAYTAGDRVAAGGGVAGENEQVEVREVPLDALWAQVTGGMADAKTFMLLHALRLRHPELFGG